MTATEAPPVADVAAQATPVAEVEVRRFLTELHRGAPGLRWIGSPRPDGTRMPGQVFPVEDVGAAVGHVVQLQATRPAGIYVRATTLTTPPPSGKRGPATDTAALPGLWGDLDFGEIGHKHDPAKHNGLTLPPDETAARSIVDEAKLPPPTLWVHSGGGLYPWWLLAEPLAVPAGFFTVVKAVSDRWQRAMVDAAARCGWHYGNVGDLARVLRIPGTWNLKAGQARQARLLETDGPRYTFAQLVAALPERRPSPKPSSVTTPRPQREYVSGPATGPFDVLDRVAAWADLLDQEGWELVRVESSGAELWRRPGATSEYSARAFEHNIVVHSTDAGLPSGADQRLTRGRLFAHLHHGGNASAAALDLLAVAAGDPAASPAARALPVAVVDAIRATCADRAAGRTDPEDMVDRTLENRFLMGGARATLPTLDMGAAAASTGGAQPAGDDRPPLRRLVSTPASKVTMRRLRWLWDMRIVLGGLTLLAGREGLGKSTIAVWLAALVTRGQLTGELHGESRTVIYVNSEDARDYTIVPRLVAAGADLDRVHFVDAVMPGADGGEFTESIVLPRDADLLADLARDEDAALVILDAATSVIDSRLDGDKDRQMRQGLEAIGRVVGEGTSAAVLGIVHFGKRDSTDTGKLILGSIAWSQVARSVLAVARNEEDGSLVLTRSKGNLGAEPPSIAVRLVSATVPTSEGATYVGRVELIGETDQDARDLLGAVQLDSEERTALDEAADWLHDYLIQHSNPPSRQAKEDGRKARHHERTIERSLKTLGVTVSSGGFPRQSYWRLPDGHSADSCARCASGDVRARELGATGAIGLIRENPMPPLAPLRSRANPTCTARLACRLARLCPRGVAAPVANTSRRYRPTRSGSAVAALTRTAVHRDRQRCRSRPGRPGRRRGAQQRGPRRPGPAAPRRPCRTARPDRRRRRRRTPRVVGRGRCARRRGRAHRPSRHGRVGAAALARHVVPVVRRPREDLSP